MRISYVRIENFRNFRDLEVELGQNLILLGENRSGKSNFIQALRLVLDPSLSDQDRYLTAQDFWDGEEPFRGREIRVTIRLTDFTDEVVALSWLSNCLTSKVIETTAQLTYIYRNEKNTSTPQQATFDDYEFRIFAGDNEVNPFTHIRDMRRYLPLSVIDALRDIANDTQSWRRSSLRRLIELADIKADTFEYGWPQCQDQKVTKIRWNEKATTTLVSSKM